MAEERILPQEVLDYVGLTEEKLQQFKEEEEAEARQRRQELIEALGNGRQNGMIPSECYSVKDIFRENL